MRVAANLVARLANFAVGRRFPLAAVVVTDWLAWW
jgi:hypothetical protein